jgi:hypothetical protein
MSTSTLGNYYAPLNPVVDISSLSISEQTTAKLDPQYYFYRNNFFPNQHLTISGLAVDQNIINVTEQTETIGFSYQLSPGVNAAVGTYEIYVSDHINNKSHPVTITIVF